MILRLGSGSSGQIPHHGLAIQPSAIQRPSGLETTCRTRRKVTSVARDGSIRCQRAVTQIALCRRTKPSQAQVAAGKEAAK
jgi:hypothetical protein